MSNPNLAEARALAQAGISVFPVAKNKRPLIKGWRHKATTDPDRIEEWFADGKGAAGVGVPCGPGPDILCFDVDLGHTEDPDRQQKLRDWVDRWYDDQSAMLRETPSGGLHIITAWPEGRRVPRRIMPKLDVICEGFYFVWTMGGDAGGYAQIGGAPLALAEEPPAGMLEVVERGTPGSGAELMTIEEADEVMRTNGDAGMRHDALLRLTQDWAEEHPSMSPARWCETFTEWFLDIYGQSIDGSRLNKLLEWRVEGDGTLSGELGRAFAGVRKTDAMLDEKLARAYEKLAAKVTPALSAAVAEAVVDRRVGDFLRVDLEELRETDLDEIDWLIKDVLPSNNMIGLAGPSGAGKTRFVAALVAAMASGRTDIIGLPKAAAPITTVYIANEEREADIQRRVKSVAMLNELHGDLPFYVRGKDSGQLRLTTRENDVDEKVVDALCRRINELNAKLVIFDPFVTLGAEDENSASGVDGVMAALQIIMGKTKAAVMFVHHTPKGDRSAPADDIRGDGSAFRGSGAIYSPLDIAMTLSPYLPPACHIKGEGKENRRLLGQLQRNRKVPRYIVLDSAKERESEGFPSIVYRLDSHAVREGGEQKIGALVKVDEQEAINAIDMALFQAAGGDRLERAEARHWAEAICAAHPVGRVTLQELHDTLAAAKVLGFTPSSAKQVRARDGAGKTIVDKLSNWVETSFGKVRLAMSENNWLQLEIDDSE